MLLLGDANKVLERSRYEGLFDAVFVSNHAATKASAWLNKIVRQEGSGHAIVIAESAKYALDFKPEHKTEFLRRVYEAAREANWLIEGAHPVDGQAESHLCFVCCDKGDAEHWHEVPQLPSPVVDDQVDEQKPNAPTSAGE